MSLALPARGTITSWIPDDSIGRIRVASGEEIRFGHSACVNVSPVLGAEVWVMEVVPHPLGGFRAKVVNATGVATVDRATAALTAHDERERLRPMVKEEVAKIEAECEQVLAPLPSPWATAKAAGIDLAPILGLKGRIDADDLSALAPSLGALDDDGTPSESLRLYAWDWSDDWRYLEIWTDPCFLAIGSSEADHVGVFAHPALAASDVPFPVVFRYHETSQEAWIAESVAHFVAMVDAALAGGDIMAARGTLHDDVRALLSQTQEEESFEDVERKDVHALFWSGSRALEAAAAERLLARYTDRGWTFARASIEAQQLLAGFEARIDAAWATLPKY